MTHLLVARVWTRLGHYLLRQRFGFSGILHGASSYTVSPQHRLRQSTYVQVGAVSDQLQYVFVIGSNASIHASLIHAVDVPSDVACRALSFLAF